MRRRPNPDDPPKGPSLTLRLVLLLAAFVIFTVAVVVGAVLFFMNTRGW